jgi:hypothetical protein
MINLFLVDTPFVHSIVSHLNSLSSPLNDDAKTTTEMCAEIDEQLPLPRKDDDQPSNKRRRRVVKKEAET